MIVQRIFLILAALIALPLGAHSQTDALSLAVEECDRTPLYGAEGIWLLPDDHIYVLVKRISPSELPEYSMRVLASLDGKTKVGSILGTLKTTVAAKTFTASLPTRRSKNAFTGFKQVELRLQDDGRTLTIVRKNNPFRFSLSPLSLLPGFWRMVRLSISPQKNEEQRGLIKVYPADDNNSTPCATPRYL